jgi:hypothetical protein
MPSQIPTLWRNLKGIVCRVHSYHSAPLSQSDPLNLWLQPSATLVVRHIEKVIREEIQSAVGKSQDESQAWNVLRETAFFFTAIFRCLFRLSKKLSDIEPNMA